MARKVKNTVDYFPHTCKPGKTIFILENKFGNDGYAFWFKLLELIGITENHYINCNNLETWEFLLAKTRVNEETANNILLTLVNLNAIDAGLWSKKIIWSDNFILNVDELYKRRNTEPITKQDLCKQFKVKCKQKSTGNSISNSIKPHSIVKESKGKDSREKDYSNIPPLLSEIKELCLKRKYTDVDNEAEKFFNHYESNGWKVGKNKMINWGAALSNWFKNKREWSINGKPGTAKAGSRTNTTTSGIQPPVDKKYKTANI